MKVKLVPIERVIPYDGNPRNADAAVNAVAESIQEFDFRQPIVVDKNSIIVAGHARYFAAVRLGIEKVPVHVAEDLTDAQIRAYRLADNKTADLAGWDNDLLAKEIASLSDEDLDLTRFGFDQSFLDGLGEEVSAELSQKTGGTSQLLKLKFGKYTVPLDEAELGHLTARLLDHEQRTGTRFGFVATILGLQPSSPAAGPETTGEAA